MSPQAIVKQAVVRGLNLIALTDHNTALNCPAFAKLCQEQHIHAFYGCEITTREEVHCLCLFDSVHTALELSAHIAQHMPHRKNSPERFGDQVVVDATENILTQYPFYLGLATELSLTETARWVKAHQGLCIPAHIDRRLYSVMTQLGFLPDNEAFDAVEIHKSTIMRKAAFPDTKTYTPISNSDAHYLADIGFVYTEYDVPEISIENIRAALHEKRVTIKTR